MPFSGASGRSVMGRVLLVGAGPGDIELLTLKAVRALGRADVVLLDDLVNPDILQFCRDAVRIIRVGKRGGCRSTPQDFINRLMRRYARQGLTVARVKGGDPCIFGRAGEEKAFLERAGIVVDIINGLTSGLVAASSIGVPLTDRRFTRGVTFVTGHTKEGGTPDWSALVAGGTTLVIYMGMKQMPTIVAGLQAAGMSTSMPVAVIANASLSTQAHAVTTLGEMAVDARDAALASPAVIVVGEVVGEACAVDKNGESVNSINSQSALLYQMRV
ncbi:MAG: uroporphyrinogen-III C-methyltransferase [Moraxellaceae bacterium]|nr:uroporphyrinogen-III C-methyltransferase [Moraxellaceae bacterium]